jgi:hypothetical protein
VAVVVWQIDAPVPTSPSDADDARGVARRILAERRFKPSAVPRPLHGVLRWLGEPIRRLFAPIGRLVERIAGNHAALAVPAAAVVALTVLVSTTLIRRRGPHGARRFSTRPHVAGDDAETLERQAVQAEQEGNLELAFRLRFRAGVVRLHRLGAVSLRPSTTSGQLVRQLRLSEFEDMAMMFDQVAYGQRRLASSELDAARANWSRVLEDVSRR